MPSLKLAPNQTVSGMWSKPFFCAIGGRDGRSSKEIKKFFAADTAAAMKADIQAIEEASAVIDRDVQAILTRAEAKAKTKGAAISTRAEAKAKTKGVRNDLIVNTDKTVIEVSSDGEFEAFIIDEEVMNMFR